MTIDLSAYLLEIGDTRDLVDKINAVITALQGAQNDTSDDLDARLDDQDAIIAALSGAITSGVTFKGSHSAAGGTYPSTPSSGDYWIISVTGTISNIYYAVGDAIVYSGSTWIKIPANPDMSRINPLARAVRVAMIAGTGTGIIVRDDDNVNPGASDFALWVKCILPDYTPSANVYLLSKRQDASNYILLSLNTSGMLSLVVVVAGVTIISATSTVAVSAADGECVFIAIPVVRETASSAGSVGFSVNGVTIDSAVIASAATVSISNTASLECGSWNSARREIEILNYGIYNRAPAGSEILRHSKVGPALADIGASQTPVYASDFSAGTDGWAAVNGSLTGNNDAVSDGVTSHDNCLMFSIGTDGAAAVFYNSVSTDEFGKYNRTTISIYVPAGQTYVDGFRVLLGSTSGPLIFDGQGMAGQWVDIDVDVLNDFTTTTAVVYALSGASYTIDAAAAGEAIYAVSSSVTRTGITGQWRAEDCQGDTGQMFDCSGNKNHALLPASGATRIPAVREFEVRWTNTWAGTHEAQYIGGTNQAILNANACITSIVGKVSGASSQNIIVGDGSDGDRFVASVALVDGVQVFTIANATTDGTNRKLVADPDANFTGSIIWTIRGYILEA